MVNTKNREFAFPMVNAGFFNLHLPWFMHGIVCADSVTRGLVRDHPSMNMKIGTLVPGYVLSANLSL